MDMCYDGELVLPSSYSVMNEEEMTYVEGGIGKSVKWWGIQISLNSRETNVLAVGSSAYNYAISVTVGIPVAAAGVFVGALATFRGALLTAYNDNNSGVNLNFTWAHIAAMVLSPFTAPATIALTVPIKDRG